MNTYHGNVTRDRRRDRIAVGVKVMHVLVHVTVCRIWACITELTHQNSRVPQCVRRMTDRSCEVRIHFSLIDRRLCSALIAGHRLLRMTRSGRRVAQVRNPQCEGRTCLQQAGRQRCTMTRNTQSAPCQRCFSQRTEQVSQTGMCNRSGSGSLRFHLQPVSGCLLRLSPVQRKRVRSGCGDRGKRTV